MFIKMCLEPSHVNEVIMKWLKEEYNIVPHAKNTLVEITHKEGGGVDIVVSSAPKSEEEQF